jgi:DNA repair protein RecN (Recombination protein N)
MLNCLKIQDLAIIDALELELGGGLNVLTGETGSGKSILVGALELLLGGKGRPELVRGGAEAGEVEALFDIEHDAAVRAALREHGIAEAGQLVVRRVIAASGRSRAFVNGKLAAQPALAAITRGLLDISSQHEHHTLSDPSTHLGYLDAFAGAGALVLRMGRAYHALRGAEAALRACEAQGRERAAREALLSARIEEIEGVAPAPGEDAELEQTCKRLRAGEALQRLTTEAAERLYESSDSVVDGLAQARRCVAEAAELDLELAPLARELEGIQGQLDDAARELVRRTRSARAEPEALQRAEERLHQLTRLKRHHGGSLDAVLAALEESRAELAALDGHARTAELLAAERALAFDEAATAARALSSERQHAATRLGAAVNRELAALGMTGARIDLELSRLAASAAELALDGARLSPDGLERAELLIAPNRGEEARPLHRVASGGELSRAMLAIKCVLADLGPAGLYVFDEIDTVTGGGTAEIIGRKIRRVAEHRQVLCITHLPQIAVFADQHFKVEKVERGARTLSRVRQLSGKEQWEEIARMLGGLKITAKTRAAARELLRDARQSAA